MSKDDEEIRRGYEACPECQADLSAWAEILAECPLCGRKL